MMMSSEDHAKDCGDAHMDERMDSTQGHLDALVDVRRMTKVYENGPERLQILQEVFLAIREGETVTISGASGCGKSTLINLIAGLDRPTEGSIIVAGYDVASSHEEDLTEYRSRVIGLVFQFHYLLKDFTALENVVLPALMAGVSRGRARENARSLLAQVGLERRMDHVPAQLSGGERQRVAVARALVNDPSLILADEPTGNLDAANADVIAELLFSLVTDRGKTMILVTHDQELGNKGNRILTIEEGRIHTI